MNGVSPLPVPWSQQMLLDLGVGGPETGGSCHNICNFFGQFGFFTQLVLAVMSFGVLLIKRYREIPRRDATVFKLDASKNAIGTSTI
jgi:hypothetical protein